MRTLHFAKNNQNGWIAWATNRGHFDRNDLDVFIRDEAEERNIYGEENGAATDGRYNGKRLVSAWIRTLIRVPEPI